MARSLPTEAKEDFKIAKALYMTQSDTLGIADCLRGLGNVARVTFNYSAATASYETAIKHYEDEKRKHVELQTRENVEQGEHIDRGIADCIDWKAYAVASSAISILSVAG